MGLVKKRKNKLIFNIQCLRNSFAHKTKPGYFGLGERTYQVVLHAGVYDVCICRNIAVSYVDFSFHVK